MPDWEDRAAGSLGASHLRGRIRVELGPDDVVAGTLQTIEHAYEQRPGNVTRLAILVFNTIVHPEVTSEVQVQVAPRVPGDE